jgi:hypothetical protein
MESQELEMFQSTIKYVDEENIAIKPTCDFFQIDYRNQLDRIKGDEILGELCGKSSIVASDSKVRMMYSLPNNGFLMWVYSIPPRIVAIDLREKFKIFKKFLHRFLFSGIEKIKEIRTAHKRKKKLYRLKGIINKEITAVNAILAKFYDNQAEQLSIFSSIGQLPNSANTESLD